MRFITLLLLWANSLIAQDTRDHFSVAKDLIVWERSIPMESFSSLLSNIRESGMLLHLEADSNQIRGDLRPMAADYKKAGFSRMSTPSYLLGTHIHGFVVIKAKGVHSAVIIIKRIETEEENDTQFHRKGLRTTLESSFLRNEKIRNNFFRGSSKILDYSFFKMFDFSN